MARGQRTDSSPLVEVPPLRADRPSWTRVGVIAAIGFIIGIAWPRLAGVRLGPSLPADATLPPAPVVSSSAAPAAVTSASRAGTSALTPASSAGASALTSASSAGTAGASFSANAAGSASIPMASSAANGSASSRLPPLTVTASRGSILSCQSDDGERLRGKDCGSLAGLDALVQPRLRRIGECPDASGATGKLHLLVRVDFERGITVDLGRSRGTEAPEAYLACARKALASASVSALAHTARKYTVAYAVALASDAPSPAPAIAQAAEVPAAESSPAAVGNSAKVEWDVAIVRDAPKTGRVIARLPRGTTLRVEATRDGWFDIKYGDALESDGWVYRAAIGR